MMTLFFVVSAFLLVSGMGVVLFRNPVHCALSLFLNLLSVGVVYAMLHAHFLMAVQLIVYAGAVVVLVLFVIMLLNVSVEVSRRVSYPLLMAGGLVSVIFLGLAVPAILDAFIDASPTGISVEGTVKAMGALLFTKYMFLVQVLGVLLLASTVGAVMVARSMNGVHKPGEDRRASG